MLVPGRGYEPVGSTQEQFAARCRGDVLLNVELVEQAAIPLIDPSATRRKPREGG
jgi:hypothetical protein